MSLFEQNSFSVIFIALCLTTSSLFVNTIKANQFLLDSSENQASPQLDYFIRTGEWKPAQIDLGEPAIIGFDDPLVTKLTNYFAPATNDRGSGVNLGYLVDRPTGEDEEAVKLLEYLRQLKSQYNNPEEELRRVQDSNNVFAETISGPVNDPVDFEFDSEKRKTSYDLEGANRTNESLDALLSAYISTVLNQLHKHQKENNALEEEQDDKVSLDGHIASQSNSGRFSSSHNGGEYIDHPLALIGHQYVQGGAGEGRQLLGPEGTFENVQVIKSDRAVPSYCDPPNPCPIGYTAEDGCLEQFVNSASFSREYQAKQKCSCDNEHSLFNCASPSIATIKDSEPKSNTVDEFTTSTEEDLMSSPLNSIELEPNENKLSTLARTIQNRFGNLVSVRNLIANSDEEEFEQQQQQQH